MEERGSYQKLIRHLESYRRLTDSQEDILRQLVTVKYCSPKEVYLERGGIAKHICFIHTGYALGYEQIDQEFRLSRIWQEGQIILKTDSLLAFQRSEMNIIFPEGGNIIEIPVEHLLQATELTAFFHYLLLQELKYYQQQENLFRLKNSRDLIRWFHHRYADIRFKLTDLQIAQFLGITLRWYNQNKNNPILE